MDITSSDEDSLSHVTLYTRNYYLKNKSGGKFDKHLMSIHSSHTGTYAYLYHGHRLGGGGGGGDSVRWLTNIIL